MDLGFFFYLFFGHKACGILVLWLGIEPTHLAEEGSFNHCTDRKVLVHFFNKGGFWEIKFKILMRYSGSST